MLIFREEVGLNKEKQVRSKVAEGNIFIPQKRKEKRIVNKGQMG
jgi:hypothetical protein